MKNAWKMQKSVFSQNSREFLQEFGEGLDRKMMFPPQLTNYGLKM